MMHRVAAFVLLLAAWPQGAVHVHQAADDRVHGQVREDRLGPGVVERFAERGEMVTNAANSQFAVNFPTPSDPTLFAPTQSRRGRP